MSISVTEIPRHNPHEVSAAIKSLARTVDIVTRATMTVNELMNVDIMTDYEEAAQLRFEIGSMTEFGLQQAFSMLSEDAVYSVMSQVSDPKYVTAIMTGDFERG